MNILIALQTRKLSLKINFKHPVPRVMHLLIALSPLSLDD